MLHQSWIKERLLDAVKEALEAIDEDPTLDDAESEAELIRDAVYEVVAELDAEDFTVETEEVAGEAAEEEAE